jgi:hypothetical protein
MLGSNPSADSVASTDPGDATSSPFQLSAGESPASGEAPRRKILGVRGQSPRRLRRRPTFLLKHGRPLIMHNFSVMTGSLRLWLWTVVRQTNSA